MYTKTCFIVSLLPCSSIHHHLCASRSLPCPLGHSFIRRSFSASTFASSFQPELKPHVCRHDAEKPAWRGIKHGPKPETRLHYIPAITIRASQCVTASPEGPKCGPFETHIRQVIVLHFISQPAVVVVGPRQEETYISWGVGDCDKASPKGKPRVASEHTKISPEYTHGSVW